MTKVFAAVPCDVSKFTKCSRIIVLNNFVLKTRIIVEQLCCKQPDNIY